MDIGVIDIGTNTVLLLVARFDRDGKMTPVVYEQRVPRLGKGVDSRKQLQPDSMQRVLEALREYKKIIKQHRIAALVVCGTSALRDAHNGQEFVNLIRSKFGFDVEILSGKDEALWTYRGAISGVPGIHKATVLDIGGGSTEISSGDTRDIAHWCSLDIGSVRLTERFFAHDPPTPAEMHTAQDAIETALAAVHMPGLSDSTLIGVAGTATSLAILAQGFREFSLDAVSNYVLRIAGIRDLLVNLKEMPSPEIRNLSAIMEGRSDVITAGALILQTIMARFSFDQIIVSERGVRYGLAIREWERKRRMEETGYRV